MVKSQQFAVNEAPDTQHLQNLNQSSSDRQYDRAEKHDRHRNLSPPLWVTLQDKIYLVQPQLKRCLVKRAFEPVEPGLRFHRKLSWRSYSFNDLFLFQVGDIYLEPNLSELEVKTWVDVCQRSNRSVTLNLPAYSDLPQMTAAWSWRIKKVLDKIASVILLGLLSPLFLALAIVISLDSPGPIFFKQWRVGQGGKLFQIYKFRTMVPHAETLHHRVMSEQQGLHKCKDDPRITRCGYWMRKYSLDELPQLLNVVRGEMSLVGPRPWALYDALRISPEGQKRLNALPGITGAWQVEARSMLLDLEDVNHCDLQYLRNWSLWQDFKILLLTVPKVFSGFGAC